jgi:Sugar kinases, ribokinase family
MHVVFLHDFFLDHFLRLSSWEKTVFDISRIYNQGGGNLTGVTQELSQGGSATNGCKALHTLGIKTSLICKTSQFGYYLLKHFLKGIDLTHVKKNGKLGKTTALEFSSETNVMINDLGSNGEFSFEDLNEEDLKLIQNCDLLAIFNWSLNTKYGTELISKLLDFSYENDIRTFLDTNDPSGRKDKDIKEFRENILKHRGLNILGLNENELKVLSGKNDTEEAIKELERFCRIDLHTKSFSYSRSKYVEGFRVKEKRLTGAGDHWSAADIYGEIMGYDDEQRLKFANGFASLYVKTGKTPDFEKTVKFLEEQVQIDR